jgi:integrase
MTCQDKKERDRLHALLSDPRLGAWRGTLRPLAAAGKIDASDVRLFLGWLGWRQKIGRTGLPSAQEYAKFFAARPKGSVAQLKRLFRMASPGGLEILEIDEYRLSCRGPRPARSRPAAPRGSLPPEFRTLFARIADGDPGCEGNSAPAPSLHPAIRKRLVNFAQVQSTAGLPVEFGEAQCQAYADWLRRRPLASRSIEFSLSLLSRCVHHAFGHGPATVALNAELRRQRKVSRSEPKLKDLLLRRSQLTLEAVFDKGQELLDQIEQQRASDTRFCASRYCLSNKVALMGLVIAAAPRLADVTTLILGQQIWWNPQLGWEIGYDSQKTGERTDVPIDPDLFPLFDQAILHGADESLFEMLYKKRIGTPFLVKNAAFEPYAYEWPSNRFREIFRTGLHIVRTLWYDRCAAEGYDAILTAQEICGHGGRQTRKHYLSDSARWKLSDQASSMLQSISKEISKRKN